MHCFVFGSDVIGGHEMMAAQIVRAVAEGGHPGRVIARSANFERLRAICGEMGIDYVALRHGAGRYEGILGFLNPRVYIAALELQSKTNGCRTIVSVNGGVGGNHALTLGLLLAGWLRGGRLVLYYPMLHSQEELELSGLRTATYRAALRRIVRHVDHYLTIDAVWRERLAKISRRKLDIAVVHNWVDRRRFRNAVDRARPASDGTLKICFVGRLDRFQKGLDLFIEVAKTLAADSNAPRLQFGIIGDGPFGPELKRRCAELQNDRLQFVFHGWQRDAVPLMEAHDILILPSRIEGVPTVVIEALMAGLQVLAFDIAGMNHLVQQDWLVPAFDTAAMARRLCELAVRRDVPARADNPYIEMVFDRGRFAEEVRRALCS